MSKQSRHPSDDKVMRLFALSIVPLLIIILGIWVPYGFATTGLLEEWGVLGLFNQYGPIFFTHIQGPLSVHALRPLTVLPHALAWTLDKNSFDYWHLITILSLLLKGMAASYLVWAVTGSRFWSVLMGVLVLLFPADTMQLALRGIGINSALALSVMAGACCVAAFQTSRSVIAYSLALIASGMMLASLMIYEAGLGLILLPFIVLFACEGLRKALPVSRSRIVISIIWFSSLIIYLIYCLIVSPKIHSYQSMLYNDAHPIRTFLGSLPKLFTVGFFRSLIGGWFDALRITIKEYNLTGYIYLSAVTAITGLFLLFVIRTSRGNFTETGLATEKIKRLALAGILLIALGYGPYLMAPSHLVISQRTFLFATPGAAMVWIAILARISHWQKGIAIFLSIFAIFIGLGAQLFQFEHYTRLSDTQRYLLKNIIENFDGNTQNKTVFILDKSSQLDKTWMFPAGYLASALSYFYNHPINSLEICYLPTHEWRSSNSLGHMGTCIENKKSWIFRPAPVPGKKQPDQIIAKNKMIILTVNTDGTLTPAASLNAYRDTLHNDNSISAKRYRNILALQRHPFGQSLWVKDKSQYKWHFGDWWSMDIPVRGSGWMEAEWTVHFFHPHAAAYKINEKATLLFNLVPTQKPYILKGRFIWFAKPDIQKSMQIKINQHPITLQWYDNGKFKASIPTGILLSGVNIIEFDSKVDPDTGFSASLQYIEVLTGAESL